MFELKTYNTIQIVSKISR